MNERCFQYAVIGLLAYIGAMVTDNLLTSFPMLLGAGLFFVAALFSVGNEPP